MGSEWTVLTIAECASSEPYSTQIGPFGEKIRSETYTSTGAPVLRGTNVNPVGRFYDDDFVFIDSDLAEREFSKFVCEAGDVVLCHKGTLGKIGVIPKNSKFKKYIMGNSMMKVRCDPSKLEPLFLYYWLCSKAGQDYIFSRVSQVGVPQIQRPLTTLREASFPVAPLTEQRAIVHILGTLDDKIELNRKQNETLEAMAGTLFQAWFVDFEPVRAKMEGRWQRGQSLPGLPAHLFDLFPDRLIESELGEIPDGWKIGMLGDIFSLRNERTQPSKETAMLPYVPIENIGAKNPFLSEWMSGEKANSSLILFKQGDILFGAMRPYFHKVCIAPFDGVTRTTVFTLKPYKPEISAYALMLAYQDSTVEWATLHSEGSTIPYTKWKNSFEKMSVILPPEEIQIQFSDVVSPLIENANANIEISATLSHIRDTLLPKLISGELRVPDADHIGQGK